MFTSKLHNISHQSHKLMESCFRKTNNYTETSEVRYTRPIAIVSSNLTLKKKSFKIFNVDKRVYLAEIIIVPGSLVAYFYTQ